MDDQLVDAITFEFFVRNFEMILTRKFSFIFDFPNMNCTAGISDKHSSTVVENKCVWVELIEDSASDSRRNADLKFAGNSADIVLAFCI